MSRLALGCTATFLSVLVLAGCGASAGGPSADGGETVEQRAAAIYAAALEAFLADAPGAVGQPAAMYVVEQAYDEAGWNPEIRNRQGEAIPSEVQVALGEALAGTADLAWVPSADDVVKEGISEAGISCPSLRDGDLVVTLDRLPEDGAEEVSVSAVGHEFDHQSCAVFWLSTFVVAPAVDGWTVTGETGPQAVS